MCPLYKLLIQHFKTQQRIADVFQVTRQAVSKWKLDGIPEHIAHLCGDSESLPYQFNPSEFGKNYEGLSLHSIKPTKEVTTNENQTHQRAA